MPRQLTRAVAAFGVALALSACTDPYDPGQRALAGGAIGAGAGAAIGGAAAGWHGAAIGALAGGAVGAVTGAVTTPRPPPRYSPPPPPPPRGYYQPQGYPPPQYLTGRKFKLTHYQLLNIIPGMHTGRASFKPLERQPVRIQRPR